MQPAAAGIPGRLLEVGPAATARPRERSYPAYKQCLLLALCVLWLVPGLVGRSPWKPVETLSVQVVEESYARAWLDQPELLGEAYPSPPLYLQIAGLARRALAGPLARHDAMRIPNFAWVGLALLAVGLLAGASRSNNRYGWRAVLLLVGCIGLLLQARMLNPDLALLASSAWLCWGLWQLPTRPKFGIAAVGASAGIGLAAAGGAALLQALLALFALWALPARGRARASGGALAAAAAAALLCAAPWMPDAALPALERSGAAGGSQLLAGLLLGVRDLLWTGFWSGWPAVPLMLLAAYAMRSRLLADDAGKPAAAAFAAGCAAYVLAATHAESSILIILPPAAVMAAIGLRSIPQEIARSFDYFAIVLIGGVLILGSWTLFAALHAGWPAGLSARLAEYGITDPASVSGAGTAVALAATCGYLFSVLRVGKSFDRLTINWSCGLVMGWFVLSALWLPAVDQARDYAPLAQKMAAALPPAEEGCIARPSGEPSAAIAQLAYRTGRDFHPYGSAAAEGCRWLMGTPGMLPGPAVAAAAREGRPEEIALYRLAQ